MGADTASALKKVPQAAALFPAELILALPWGHHAELMSKVKDLGQRQWYMRAAFENGWSRNILVMQIESAAHRRHGQTASNFALRFLLRSINLRIRRIRISTLKGFVT